MSRSGISFSLIQQPHPKLWVSVKHLPDFLWSTFKHLAPYVRHLGFKDELGAPHNSRSKVPAVIAVTSEPRWMPPGHSVVQVQGCPWDFHTEVKGRAYC
ncbi:unnamed protein product [Lota lota]